MLSPVGPQAEFLCQLAFQHGNGLVLQFVGPHPQLARFFCRVRDFVFNVTRESWNRECFDVPWRQLGNGCPVGLAYNKRLAKRRVGKHGLEVARTYFLEVWNQSYDVFRDYLPCMRVICNYCLPVNPVCLAGTGHEKPTPLDHVGIEVDIRSWRQHLRQFGVDLEDWLAIKICGTRFTIDTLETSRQIDA